MPFVSFDWNRNPSSTRCLTSGCTGPRKGAGAQPQDVRRPKVITDKKWKTFVIIGLAFAALLVAAIGVVARSWVVLLLAGIMTSPLAWYLSMTPRFRVSAGFSSFRPSWPQVSSHGRGGWRAGLWLPLPSSLCC